jgi:hypothetical protein
MESEKVLIVISDFYKYKKGEVIRGESLISEILKNYARHVNAAFVQKIGETS